MAAAERRHCLSKERWQPQSERIPASDPDPQSHHIGAHHLRAGGGLSSPGIQLPGRVLGLCARRPQRRPRRRHRQAFRAFLRFGQLPGPAGGQGSPDGDLYLPGFSGHDLALAGHPDRLPRPPDRVRCVALLPSGGFADHVTAHGQQGQHGRANQLRGPGAGGRCLRRRPFGKTFPICCPSASISWPC